MKESNHANEAQKETNNKEEPLEKGFAKALEDGYSYPEIICKETFNPSTPWKTWKKTKDYNMEVSSKTSQNLIDFLSKIDENIRKRLFGLPLLGSDRWYSRKHKRRDFKLRYKSQMGC